MFTVKINVLICFNKSRMRIKKHKVYFESKIMSNIKTSIHKKFGLFYILIFLSKYGLHSSESDDSQRWQLPGKLYNMASHNIHSRSGFVFEIICNMFVPGR